MEHKYLWTLGAFLACSLCIQAQPSSFSQANLTQIIHQGKVFKLLWGGKQIYLQGAVADDATALPNIPPAIPDRLGVLKNCGANAARLASNAQILDTAFSHGLVGIVDLILPGERDGMDWANDSMVAEMTEKTCATVRQLKDHPAVAMWVIGNELDYIPPNEPYHPRIWQRLNDLARAIKAIDPNHLVLTIVGTSRFEEKIKELARDGSSLDLLGLNAYGDIDRATALLRQYWPKPYIITEWGPTGHWEVPRTVWGAPIEQTSSEKAALVDERYRKVIRADSSHCLGSFIFYWSHKQETTHTWYGLFCEQLRTQSIDVMERNWSEKLPGNQAPSIFAFELNGNASKNELIVRPGKDLSARVTAWDPEGHTLSYVWTIRPEVIIPPGNYAGRKEKPAPILKRTARNNGVANLNAPLAEGAYRLFVVIKDDHGAAAYANFPFWVAKNGRFRKHE